MTGFFERTFWWVPFGSVPEITTDELKRLVNKTRGRPQILDVRYAREWNEAHIRGSLNVSLNLLQSQMKALPFDKEKPVIAVCHSARRTIMAVRLLRMNGYKHAKHLKGGMTAWTQAGLPTKSVRG